MIGKAARRAVAARRRSQRAAATRRSPRSRKALDELPREERRTDKWARWLKARALLAGRRAQGRQARRSRQPPTATTASSVAMIDHADLLVDDGQLDEALALYDKALAKAKDHPLARVGKLARARRGVGADRRRDRRSQRQARRRTRPRVSAYRNLALALADAGIEDYARSARGAAQGDASRKHAADRAAVLGARRVGALRARRARRRPRVAASRIAWYGKTKAEDDPIVQLVDAGAAARVGPARARRSTSAAKLDGVRPQHPARVRRCSISASPRTRSPRCRRRAQEGARQPRGADPARAGAHGRGSRASKERSRRRPTRSRSSRARRRASSAATRSAWRTTTIGDMKNAQTAARAGARRDQRRSRRTRSSYRTRTALADILLANNDIAGARQAARPGARHDRQLRLLPDARAAGEGRAARTATPTARSTCSTR